MYNCGCQGHRIGWNDEMDIADCCHDFVSLYIDIYNFPNIVKRTVTAIRFWWFFTRFFLASKHICKMQIRHSIARAEWFPWDAWKFGPAFERQPASTAPEMSVVRTWLRMPLHVVSRFVHQVAHCFHPVRQHLRVFWVFFDSYWNSFRDCRKGRLAVNSLSWLGRPCLALIWKFAAPLPMVPMISNCHMAHQRPGFRATWSIRSWWHLEAWSYWPCCWDAWQWRRNGGTVMWPPVVQLHSHPHGGYTVISRGLPMKLMWTS